jgi:uncharacterized membrane-anchored protein
MSIVWLIFGCFFLTLPLLLNISTRSSILSLIAAVLFFINFYLNWKKYKDSVPD